MNKLKGEMIYGKQNLTITVNESKEIFVIDMLNYCEESGG